jgi:hypothetical protein
MPVSRIDGDVARRQGVAQDLHVSETGNQRCFKCYFRLACRGLRNSDAFAGPVFFDELDTNRFSIVDNFDAGLSTANPSSSAALAIGRRGHRRSRR